MAAVLMSNPLYEASVPVFRHGLLVLADLLRKGATWATDQGINPESLLAERLAPDMLPLVGQVQRVSDHAKGAVARLAGYECPSWADDERTLAEAHDRITRTLEFIGGVPFAAFDDALDRTIALPFGDRLVLPAPRYLYHSALPGFQFHMAMAYGILRHRGVPLGKRDFIGPV